MSTVPTKIDTSQICKTRTEYGTPEYLHKELLSKANQEIGDSDWVLIPISLMIPTGDDIKTCEFWFFHHKPNHNRYLHPSLTGDEAVRIALYELSMMSGG